MFFTYTNSSSWTEKVSMSERKFDKHCGILRKLYFKLSTIQIPQKYDLLLDNYRFSEVKHFVDKNEILKI